MRTIPYCVAKGSVGTEYVKQGATFFGPNTDFEQTWDISAAALQSVGYANQTDRIAAQNDETVRHVH